jgi:hypothetical protein
MVRLTMILLCFLLAAAAWGRYRAEASVREARREIQELGQAQAKEISQVQVLRAEIAYLESPERLAKIARSVTDLEPLSGRQLMTADEFLVAFGDEAGPRLARPPADRDLVLHALAMADVKLAE